MEKLGGAIGELNSVKAAIRYYETKMSKDLIEHHDVICATCIGACDEILEGFKFPVVIIDGTLLLPRLPLL